MKVLVPVDGSECSFNALEFATAFAKRYEATLHVVHFVEQDADEESDEVQGILETVEAMLAEAGIQDEPDVVTDAWILPYRYADRVGKDILRTATEDGYDHVVMGHHGMGAVGRALLGSAAETVMRAAEVPVTVIP